MDTIPARRGKATYLRQGQSIRIIYTHDEQVVGNRAFTAGMLTEFTSMEHIRAMPVKLRPQAGDGLYANRRRKILTMTEDRSRGDHDTLMGACDSERHPAPLNLFMNIPWTPSSGLSFDPPMTKPGDCVTLRAELDCIVAMSASPRDTRPINGTSGKPIEAHFQVIG